MAYQREARLLDAGVAHRTLQTKGAGCHAEAGDDRLFGLPEPTPPSRGGNAANAVPL